jgi:hypothetical protein
MTHFDTSYRLVEISDGFITKHSTGKGGIAKILVSFHLSLKCHEQANMGCCKQSEC